VHPGFPLHQDGAQTIPCHFDHDHQSPWTAKLSEPASASIGWAANNGDAFDQGKTEAAIVQRRKTPPTATVAVEANTVPLNKEAPRWFGVWLDSQLTLKYHHATWLNLGKKAMARLR